MKNENIKKLKVMEEELKTLTALRQELFSKIKELKSSGSQETSKWLEKMHDNIITQKVKINKSYLDLGDRLIKSNEISAESLLFFSPHD